MSKLRGWRKYSIAAATLVLSFVLALYGLLTADFALIASVVNGAFSAGNGIERWAETKRGIEK